MKIKITKLPSNTKSLGGVIETHGSDFTNGLMEIREGGTHESNPLDGVPMGFDSEGIPNLVEEGETVYNDYVFSDRMKVPFFMYKELGLGGVMKKKGKEMSFADASKKLAQESEQRPNDPISQAGLQASLAKLAEVQETERMRQQAKEYMGLQEYACGGSIKNKYGNGTEDKSRRDSNNPYGRLLFDPHEDEVREAAGFGQQQPVIDEPTRQAIARDGYTPEYTPESAAMVDFLTTGTPMGTEYKEKAYPTWMRYAPTIGAGIMSLTDAFGLTNKPDYGMADKLEAAASKIGDAPHVEADPIGNYLRYTPMDIWYEQNRLNANARATDRAILNSNSPSRTAALLANGYNSQLASGNLYRQALEYNDAKRQAVENFNRGTNMFNSQMGLEAAMANARYRQQAAQMSLSGLAQAAALRDQIDARTGAAKSANITNFLTSLGNIGRENFALNQINSDRSRQYGVDNRGVSSYKRTKKTKK